MKEYEQTATNRVYHPIHDLLTFEQVKDNPDVMRKIADVLRDEGEYIMAVVKLNPGAKLKIVFYGSRKPENWKFMIF